MSRNDRHGAVLKSSGTLCHARKFGALCHAHTLRCKQCTHSSSFCAQEHTSVRSDVLVFPVTFCLCKKPLGKPTHLNAQVCSCTQNEVECVHCLCLNLNPLARAPVQPILLELFEHEGSHLACVPHRHAVPPAGGTTFSVVPCICRIASAWDTGRSCAPCWGHCMSMSSASKVK